MKSEFPVKPDGPSRDHYFEPHNESTSSKLNWLRAGVLGANDGIVSTALVLQSVIASGASSGVVFTAGSAAVIAGAISMALGEYVSVSTQRDTEKALIAKEQHELEHFPDHEHQELVGLLVQKGVNVNTAEQAAREIEDKDPLQTHLALELGIDGEDLTSPWAAAGSSALSFVVGALLPLLAAVFTPGNLGVLVVTLVTILALALTGYVSAKLSETHSGIAAARLVVGGALGLAISYGVGLLFGQAVA